jgi:hypothetical protein
MSKTVTIKNGEAQDILSALKKLAALSIPISFSLKIRRLTRAIQTIAGDVEEERVERIRSVAVKDKDGEVVLNEGQNTVKFPTPEIEAECEQQINELMEMSTEALPVITLADFGPKITDETRADHVEIPGLTQILIDLKCLFEE